MKRGCCNRPVLVIGLMLLMLAGARGAPPTITYQPKSQRVLLDQPAVFGVLAEGSPPLTYQWFKNRSAIGGATNDQIVIAQARFSDEARYSVAVVNADGSVSGTNAQLVVRLPQAGDLDGSFLTGGSIDEVVRAIAVQADGKIIIAGDFTHITGVPRGRIARLNPDGTTDYPFQDGLAGVNGTVQAVAVQPDGKILLGGLFTQVNGVGRTNIARLNADGSLDTGFQNGMGGIGSPWNNGTYVNCLALQSDGKILVAGSFDTVNGNGCSNLARLDIEGHLDTNFHAVALGWKPYFFFGGISGEVRYFVPSIEAMIVEPDDSVVIAGLFDQNVLHLNPDGTVRTTYDLTSVFAEGSPDAVCLDTNGDIIAAGALHAFRENPYPVVVRLTRGGGYQSFPGLSTLMGGIGAVVTLRDGSLFASGGFGYQGVEFALAAHFNRDGTVAQYISGQSIGIRGGLSTMLLQADGKILAGGLIVGSRSGIVRLDADTTFDSSFGNGIPTTDGGVNAVVVQPDQKLVIAGAFTMVHGVMRNHVARLLPEGIVDPAFGDPKVSDYTVYAAALQPDGKVVIGGYFTTVGQASHVGVARLNPDGSVDNAFQAQVYYPTIVYALALQPDGKIVIGGTFDFADTNGVHINIARLNSDGQMDVTFQPQATGDAIENVSQVALQADGKVLVAGGFNQVNGQARQYLARLNPDGTLDDRFAPPPQPGVPAIVVQPDGKILLGNSRLNPDGSVDPTFQPAVVGGFMLLQPDGRIVERGTTNVIRLNPDGSLDPTFQSTQTGFPLALQADGKIVLTGEGDLFRLWGADFPPVLRMPTPTSAGEQVSWHAISNRTYRVQYTDGLRANTWTTLPGDILATTDVATTLISGWSTGQARFYRVLALPP